MIDFDPEDYSKIPYPTEEQTAYAIRELGINIKYVKNPTLKQRELAIHNVLTHPSLVILMFLNTYAIECDGSYYFVSTFLQNINEICSKREKYNARVINYKVIEAEIPEWLTYTMSDILDDVPNHMDFLSFASDYDCTICYK